MSYSPLAPPADAETPSQPRPTRAARVEEARRGHPSSALSPSRTDDALGGLNRRRFLRLGASYVGGAALLQVPTLLADPSPNSRLATAVIGCGGRGEASLEAAAGERLVALVDVEESRLDAARRKVAERGAKPRAFLDYREMFDRMHGEIDAVFIATPDHHHAPASLRALALGKHVFCEKPLCHDIGQARALAAAAAERKVTTMMGNQGHCAEGYRRLCEYLWAGAIGDVVETHSWSGFVNGGAGERPPARPVPAGLHWDQWLGPAPYREYHEGLHPLYWRYYRDFGTGGLGDWGCHNLDGVFWALTPGHPTRIECLGAIGGGREKHPQASALCWHIPPRGKLPALKVYWYDGARLGKDAGASRGRIATPNYPPLLAEWEKTSERDFKEGWDGGTFYVGTKGVMHTGCYGDKPCLLPEAAHRAYPTPPRQIPRIEGTHFAHFIQCCKLGKPTCADFGYAAALTEFLLLGHLAIQAGPGAAVEWDGANLRCANLPELNSLLHPPVRPGWMG